MCLFTWQFPSLRDPRWHSDKGPTCQCWRHRRPKFNPWVRKIPWRRVCQPTPVLFLPGESHGQRSLAGCSPWGHKELDTAEGLNTWSLAWGANTHGFTQKCPSVCFSQQSNEISSSLLWEVNHTPSTDQMQTLPAMVKHDFDVSQTTSQ